MEEITQGEWKFIRNENNFEIEVFGVNNWVIAQTITNEKQDEANAKLISCAPEMLEMLKELLSCADKIFNDGEPTEAYFQLMNKNELLIKKATE